MGIGSMQVGKQVGDEQGEGRVGGWGLEVCREGIREGKGLISTVGEQGLVCVLLFCVCVFLFFLYLFVFCCCWLIFLHFFEERGGGFWVVVVFFPPFVFDIFVILISEMTMHMWFITLHILYMYVESYKD